MKTQDIIDMSPDQLRTALLEDNMETFWYMTESKEGCLILVDCLHDIAESYPKGSDQRVIVDDVRDLAFAKGLYMQLLDNQRREL